MIHIGNLIEKEMRQQGHTATWFARSLFCNRQNVYNIFQRKSIDTDLLMRISLVLHHNFFEDFSPICSQALKEAARNEQDETAGLS